MQAPQRKLKDIQRLLAAFPATSQADPALVLHNYLMAVEDWPADAVSDAVDQFMKGTVPGWDGRFAPTPPMLGAACRKAQEAVSRLLYLERIGRPALPPPDIVHTDEERARAKAQVDAFVASQGPTRLETEAADEVSRDRMARHDSFFADDFIPTDGGVGRISKTLAKKLGYSVGSPESDEAAA